MITRFEQAIEMAESELGVSLADMHGARIAGAILRAACLEYLATPRLAARAGSKQRKVEVRNEPQGETARRADFALPGVIAPQAQG